VPLPLLQRLKIEHQSTKVLDPDQFDGGVKRISALHAAYRRRRTDVRVFTGNGGRLQPETLVAMDRRAQQCHRSWIVPPWAAAPPSSLGLAEPPRLTPWCAQARRKVGPPPCEKRRPTRQCRLVRHVPAVGEAGGIRRMGGSGGNSSNGRWNSSNGRGKRSRFFRRNFFLWAGARIHDIRHWNLRSMK
jgi:hypothetical protein